MRYYDPTIGRWLTPDPAGQYHSSYVYCGNNPLNTVDPDGTTGFGLRFRSTKQMINFAISKSPNVKRVLKEPKVAIGKGAQQAANESFKMASMFNDPTMIGASLHPAMQALQIILAAQALSYQAFATFSGEEGSKRKLANEGTKEGAKQTTSALIDVTLGKMKNVATGVKTFLKVGSNKVASGIIDKIVNIILPTTKKDENKKKKQKEDQNAVDG